MHTGRTAVPLQAALFHIECAVFGHIRKIAVDLRILRTQLGQLGLGNAFPIPRDIGNGIDSVIALTGGLACGTHQLYDRGIRTLDFAAQLPRLPIQFDLLLFPCDDLLQLAGKIVMGHTKRNWGTLKEAVLSAIKRYLNRNNWTQNRISMHSGPPHS